MSSDRMKDLRCSCGWHCSRGLLRYMRRGVVQLLIDHWRRGHQLSAPTDVVQDIAREAAHIALEQRS